MISTGVHAVVVINCRHLGLLFLVSVVLGVARGGLLGQVWVQRGPRLREGAGLPARAGAGGFPHREGLHWGLCVPSALLCAVGVRGVSCPSGWSGSPGQGDLGSRDALSLGYLGVPDCEPAFFLAW